MKLNLYEQGGSDNHGCEAIVRSTVDLLGNLFDEIELFSQRPETDVRYGVDHVCRVSAQGKQIKPYSFRHFLGKAIHTVCPRWSPFYNAVRCNYLKSHGVSLQTGGDNYCYGTRYRMLGYMNDATRRRGMKSVLWGASVEPDVIALPHVSANLKKYDLITARESITYEAMRRAGIGDNLILCPDPAFLLKAADVAVDPRMAGAIGINLSPLVMRCGEAAVYESYVRLLSYILHETDQNILLIPHVVVAGNDDREPLKQLHGRFEKSGRVFLLEDADCRVLKAYIAACSFFVGARTHATIAAYSSCVPTLVLGYSVKSRGIAKDIFGTYKDYVVSVDDLKTADELTAAFAELYAKKEEIKNHLTATMPTYIAGLAQAKARVAALIREC